MAVNVADNCWLCKKCTRPTTGLSLSCRPEFDERRSPAQPSNSSSGGGSAYDENSAPRADTSASPPGVAGGDAAAAGDWHSGRKLGETAAAAEVAMTDEEFALRLQQEEQQAHLLELAGYGERVTTTLRSICVEQKELQLL